MYEADLTTQWVDITTQWIPITISIKNNALILIIAIDSVTSFVAKDTGTGVSFVAKSTVGN